MKVLKKRRKKNKRYGKRSDERKKKEGINYGTGAKNGRN